ncbi:hypothetical protein LA080_001809 [Diaporthe eres]|nr:hypothetical protein LA080_001809 [Diaporthe eres]
MPSSSAPSNTGSGSGSGDSKSTSSVPAAAGLDQRASSNSNYQIIKESWGDRPNFQASHGLSMDPEGIKEGNEILESYRQADSKKG